MESPEPSLPRRLMTPAQVRDLCRREPPENWNCLNTPAAPVVRECFRLGQRGQRHGQCLDGIALWIGLALLASLISIRVAISWR